MDQRTAGQAEGSRLVDLKDFRDNFRNQPTEKDTNIKKKPTRCVGAEDGEKMAREYRWRIFSPSLLCLSCSTIEQRDLHGDELEGREEHLGLLGHAGQGDVRQ